MCHIVKSQQSSLKGIFNPYNHYVLVQFVLVFQKLHIKKLIHSVKSYSLPKFIVATVYTRSCCGPIWAIFYQNKHMPSHPSFRGSCPSCWQASCTACSTLTAEKRKEERAGFEWCSLPESMWEIGGKLWEWREYLRNCIFSSLSNLRVKRIYNFSNLHTLSQPKACKIGPIFRVIRKVGKK